MTHSLHHLLAWLAASPVRTYLVGLALAFPLIFRSPRRWQDRLASRAPGLLAAGCVALYLAITAGYIFSNVLSDHLEPTFITTAAAWTHGLPIYPNLAGPALYGMLYGPGGPILDGISQSLLGATFFAAKLPVGLAGIATVGLLFWLLQQEFGGEQAVSGTGLVCISLLWFDAYAYAAHGDVFLLFFVCLGLAASRLRQALPSVVLGSIALALATDIKAHAPLYFLPVLILEASERGWRRVLATIGAGGLLTFAPFLLPRVSLPNYVGLLLLGLKEHRLFFYSPILLLGWAGMIFLPALLAAFGLTTSVPERFAKSLRRHGLMPVSLVAALLFTAAVASKEGAGPHHFIPFAPFAAYLFCRLTRGPEFWRKLGRPWRRTLVTAAMAWFAAAPAFAAARQWTTVHHILLDRGLATAALANLRQARREFPNAHIEMGYRGFESPATYYRAQLALDGIPPLLDAAAMMDREEARLSVPDSTVTLLREGVIQVLLLPREGEAAFSVRSWYHDHRPLFTPAFRAAFQACYAQTGYGAVYEYWVYQGCRGDSLAAPAAQPRNRALSNSGAAFNVDRPPAHGPARRPGRTPASS